MAIESETFIVGYKGEFETEGASFNDLLNLRFLSLKQNRTLTIKLGGGEDKSHYHDCYHIRPDEIVAPMIETPYAMKKYSEMIVEDFKHGINIETGTAFQNIVSILEVAKRAKKIDFVTLGRTDMSGSTGMPINSAEMLDVAIKTKALVRKHGLEFRLGGEVTEKSADFIRQLEPDKFETRNFIAKLNSDIEGTIRKMLEMEIAILTKISCKESAMTEKKQQRINTLKKRLSGG